MPPPNSSFSSSLLKNHQKICNFDLMDLNNILDANIDSSVGSNSDHPGLKSLEDSTGFSVDQPNRKASDGDQLAKILVDPLHPTYSLGAYDKWAIDLQWLKMGDAFAQGSFGKLYRGTYRGQEVAVKLLEHPEYDHERAQFQQELIMLAGLKHANIVKFIGACKKQRVWCIVTEYAKGGSVYRRALHKNQYKFIPARTAVRQALDVARGMEFVHSCGLIHRDLKSDNLLICADKSIKIADFGVATNEVYNPERMTPETETYRWMAP